MECFMKIYGCAKPEPDSEMWAEFEEWKKLKYSLLSAVTRLQNSNKITKEKGDLFRKLIANANIEELNELKKEIPAIRAGLSDVEDLVRYVPKMEELQVQPKGKNINIDQSIKLEYNKTYRLINDHKKRGIIDPEEALTRLDHLKTLTNAKDIFQYRESLKIKK